MTEESQFDPDQLDIGEDDQNRVITQMVFDTNFLQKCKRKGLEPELFSSELRRKTVEFTYEFFEKYNEAPYDQIGEILSPSSNGMLSKVSSDDLDAMINFLSILTSIENTPGRVKRLFDKISSFVEKRILFTTINQLNKARDRIDGSPDILRGIVEEASQKLGIACNLDSTLGIFDETDFSQDFYLTRFNIPSIDNATGGGLTTPNLVLLQGFTGRGKTWCICHLGKMGLRLGNDVVALVTEMNARKFLSRMRHSLTGMSIMEQRDNLELAKSRIERSLVRGSQFHLVSDQVKLDTDFYIDSLKGIVDDIEEKRGREQKIILIDSPDDMEPPRNSTYNRTSTVDKSKSIYTWLRNYSQEENKCIVVTSQSQRKVENQLWTTSGNIGDDINKSRRSTLGISINGFKNEVEAGFIRLLVFKNTYGPEMKAAWVETGFDKGMFMKSFGEIKGLNIDEYKSMLLARGINLTGGRK